MDSLLVYKRHDHTSDNIRHCFIVYTQFLSGPEKITAVADESELDKARAQAAERRAALARQKSVRVYSFTEQVWHIRGIYAAGGRDGVQGNIDLVKYR